MAAKTIIEINGKKYDARTGEIVTESVQHAEPKKAVLHQPQRTVMQGHGVIDSMQRPKRNTPTATKLKPKAQKSKTLVRSVVKKPTLEIKKEADNTPAVESNYPVFNRTSVDRRNRADSTPQSKKVSRFGIARSTTPKVDPNMEVKKEPVAEQAALQVAPPISVKKSAHPTEKQVFTHPLANANAHLALPPKKRGIHYKITDKLRVSSKTVGIVAACMSILILGGFFAYQRVPNLSMRIAAAKAGFSGTIPNDTPAGYSFKGPVEYAKNTIGINYKSNSDNRNFKIVQRPTSWSNEALVANYVKNSNLKYQTYEDKGLKVYVMESNNAAWIDSGIWYTLSSSGALSTEQILSIAGSM